MTSLIHYTHHNQTTKDKTMKTAMITTPQPEKKETKKKRQITFDSVNVDYVTLSNICQALMDIGAVDITITTSLYNNICIEFNDDGLLID